MYPLSLRSKTRWRATPLLPTWIHSCQSVGAVNFAFSFTTNVTISISILQTFRSWVATSRLRPPMAFLSHNLSNGPGLAPLMNVKFRGRCHYSKAYRAGMWQVTFEIVFKAVLWSVRGSNQIIWGIPFPNVAWLLEDDHIQLHPPLITHCTHFDPVIDLDLSAEFDFLSNCARFPWNICNGCGMPTEEAYSSGHLVLSHWGFANALLLRQLTLNLTLNQYMTLFPDWAFYRIWC